MKYAVIATPDDALGFRLDWKHYSYAGKFVMTNTGKAVAADSTVLGQSGWPPSARVAETDGVYAAASFNRDREDGDVAWIRYVTVRDDRQGEGIAPRLCAATTGWLLDSWDVSRVRIAVNNPYAYDALYKAGFGWTGEETGLRERILEHPTPPDAVGRYGDGLRSYLDAEPTDAERAFVDDRLDRGPPPLVDAPKGEDYTGGARTHR